MGIANFGDSLFAMKRLVFEEKDVNYSMMIEILDRNFQGNEMLRYRILNRIPKFGNNVPEVDNIAYRWSRLYNREVEKYENPRVSRAYRKSCTTPRRFYTLIICF